MSRNRMRSWRSGRGWAGLKERELEGRLEEKVLGRRSWRRSHRGCHRGCYRR